jgi:hypothetical protein
MESMAPVLAIVQMAAGAVLKKETGPTPLARLCSFRQPGQAQIRRLRTRLGAPIAIKAMAAKLARLVYRMLRYGMNFVHKEQPSTHVDTETYRSSASRPKPKS